MELSSARILITGGGTGIGLAIARRLRAADSRVAICGRRQNVLDEAATVLGATPLVGDVSQPDDAERIVSEAIVALGGLDVLINNAAIGYFAPLLETDTERMRQVLDVNVIGATLMAQACSRHFIAQGNGGTIVNIGSTASHKGFAGGGAYAASKFALAALSQCWRAELRQHDIRVMQVNPSEVQTNFGGRDGSQLPINETKLVSDDVAHLVEHLITLADRSFVTDITLWATNPQSG